MEKREVSSTYDRVLRLTSLFGSVQALALLGSIIRTKIVTWLLGPTGWGLVSLLNSSVKLVSDSTNLGIPISGVRSMSEAAEENRLNEVRRIRTWSLLTAAAGLLLCLLAAPLLDSWTFSWGDHRLHFVCLSPVVALYALAGGETAILKGTQQIQPLARLSLWMVALSLVVSVPLYWLWGESAAVPVLLLMALGQWLLTLRWSTRCFPYRLHDYLHLHDLDGRRLVGLGMAFVLAGVMGSGAEFAVRSFLNNSGGQSVVGLYSAGYAMLVTYGSMVFASMETDFYPRLSASWHEGAGAVNTIVNRQSEVLLLLASPVALLLMVGLPLLLPLLYSGRFLPALGMMQVASLALFTRALKLPVAYMPLARGDSWFYLMMEAIYDVVMVSLVVSGYLHWGLTGTGYALLGASVFDLVLLWCCMGLRYGYRPSRSLLGCALFQLPIGVATWLAITHVETTWAYCLVSAVAVALSGGGTALILKLKIKNNKVK